MSIAINTSPSNKIASRAIESHIPALAVIDLEIIAAYILLGETSLIAAIERFRATYPIEN